MKRSIIIAAFVGLLLAAGLVFPSMAQAQERTDFGWVSIPRDMTYSGQDENGPVTVTIPKGDYRLMLFKFDDGNYGLSIQSGEINMVYGLDTKVTEASAAQAEPKASVNVVKKDGEDWVEIRALTGKIEAVSLLKCAK